MSFTFFPIKLPSIGARLSLVNYLLIQDKIQLDARRSVLLLVPMCHHFTRQAKSFEHKIDVLIFRARIVHAIHIQTNLIRL